MAENEGRTLVKDEKQLKREKKEQERLQKEREKQEKKLERERKKQEEKERKQREKEAKAQLKAQQASGPAATSSVTVEPTVEKPDRAGETEDQKDPQQSKGIPDHPQPPETTDPQLQAPTDAQVDVLADVSVSWPEKVTVAEPPGQITDSGQPISITFDTSQAGDGSLKTFCKGANIGQVPMSVTELRKGLISVKFTPEISDIYTLSVQWGEQDITGSPFTINLSRLVSPPEEAERTQQREEEKKKEEQKEKEEEEEVVEDFSDDPFEMAFQASRLLEEQRHLAEMETARNPTAIRPHKPSPEPISVPATRSRRLENPPHQPSKAAHIKPSTEQRGTSSAVPYPVNGALASMPQPAVTPGSHEGLKYLQELNKSLQETNTELGDDLADLKKKMSEFEQKLNTMEQSTRIADEEKKVLMGHMNMRGWMYKRGIKGPTANVWRQRYFRCDQGSKICYYKSSDETVPRGHIDLEKIEKVEEVMDESMPEPSDFNIVCGERTYELRADSEATKKQWMATIQYLKDWFEKNPYALSPPRLP